MLPEAIKNRDETLAKTYASSITLGTGQFCTNPGLLFGVKSESLSKFIKSLSEEIVKIEPTCMLHPNIIGAYKAKKAKAINQSNLAVVADYEGNVKSNYARQAILAVDGEVFLANPTLHQEVFGPFSMVVECENANQLKQIISKLEGQLTGTIIAENDEASNYGDVISALQNRVGRIIYNGVPTGVEICPSMVHGGPYPASTDSRFTAVGIHSIKRWVRPFSYQDWPNKLLPDELKNENPLGILRTINSKLTVDKID
jgi:NADP-dependent aldehyde dehydrogenase